MGILSKALPREQQTESSQQAKVQSPRGVYRGFFVGMTDPIEQVDAWGGQCRLCKGQGSGYNGEGDCRACHGSGKKTDEKAHLLYSLENGIVEQEEVNFKLSGPGQLADGKPRSPSTLFVRLRTISGIANATEAQLDEWYSSLTKPIKIPVQVIIGSNDKGTMDKITEVVRPAATVQRPAPRPAADLPDVEPFDADEWANIEDSRP